MERTRPAKGCPDPDSITVYPVQDSAKGQTPRTTETRKRDAVSGRPRLNPAGTCGFISPTQGGCSGWEPGLSLVLVFKLSHRADKLSQRYVCGLSP